MNKETIYKKVQDLFPSSLGVGDVVESKRSGMDWRVAIIHKRLIRPEY